MEQAEIISKYASKAARSKKYIKDFIEILDHFDLNHPEGDEGDSIERVFNAWKWGPEKIDLAVYLTNMPSQDFVKECLHLRGLSPELFDLYLKRLCDDTWYLYEDKPLPYDENFEPKNNFIYPRVYFIKELLLDVFPDKEGDALEELFYKAVGQKHYPTYDFFETGKIAVTAQHKKNILIVAEEKRKKEEDEIREKEDKARKRALDKARKEAKAKKKAEAKAKKKKPFSTKWISIDTTPKQGLQQDVKDFKIVGSLSFSKKTKEYSQLVLTGKYISFQSAKQSAKYTVVVNAQTGKTIHTEYNKGELSKVMDSYSWKASDSDKKGYYHDTFGTNKFFSKIIKNKFITYNKVQELFGKKEYKIDFEFKDCFAFEDILFVVRTTCIVALNFENGERLWEADLCKVYDSYSCKIRNADYFCQDGHLILRGEKSFGHGTKVLKYIAFDLATGKLNKKFKGFPKKPTNEEKEKILTQLFENQKEIQKVSPYKVTELTTKDFKRFYIAHPYAVEKNLLPEYAETIPPNKDLLKIISSYWEGDPFFEYSFLVSENCIYYAVHEGLVEYNKQTQKTREIKIPYDIKDLVLVNGTLLVLLENEDENKLKSEAMILAVQ